MQKSKTVLCFKHKIARFRYHLFLLLLFTLTAYTHPSISYAMVTAEISGSCLKDSSRQPLAGVFVGLYDDKGHQIGSTNSDENGKFLLQAPQNKGNFRVVIAKDEFSYSESFAYDPQKPLAMNMVILIPAQSTQSGWYAEISNIWKQVSSSTLLGGVLGWAFKTFWDWRKQREDYEKKFKKKYRGIRDLVQDIEEDYNRLKMAVDQKNDAKAGAALSKLKKNSERLEAELEPFFDITDEVKRGKIKERDSDDLRKIVKEIRIFSENKDPASLMRFNTQAWEQKTKDFNSLRNQLSVFVTNR